MGRGWGGRKREKNDPLPFYACHSRNSTPHKIMHGPAYEAFRPTQNVCNINIFFKKVQYLLPRVTITPFSVEKESEGKPWKTKMYYIS